MNRIAFLQDNIQVPKMEYSVNNLENGEQECEAMIIFDNNYYYIHGCIPETEFKEILEYSIFLLKKWSHLSFIYVYIYKTNKGEMDL